MCRCVGWWSSKQYRNGNSHEKSSMGVFWHGRLESVYCCIRDLIEVVIWTPLVPALKEHRNLTFHRKTLIVSFSTRRTWSWTLRRRQIHQRGHVTGSLLPRWREHRSLISRRTIFRGVLIRGTEIGVLFHQRSQKIETTRLIPTSRVKNNGIRISIEDTFHRFSDSKNSDSNIIPSKSSCEGSYAQLMSICFKHWLLDDQRLEKSGRITKPYQYKQKCFSRMYESRGSNNCWETAQKNFF